MTMIEAKVIADSVSEVGKRITTLQLVYPRFIHAEFMTHRVFSRNASSSRAIPVAKMIEQVRTNPAMPIHWGKNQAGMQAREELTGVQLAIVRDEWKEAAYQAAEIAESMMNQGAHKQIANRILEPFQHIHVVVTATEFDNFFALRDHPDAQPEIRQLAICMKNAMAGSVQRVLKEEEWHLPYILDDEHDALPVEDLCKISAARCARVSYLKHDGTSPDVAEDLALFTKLVGSVPIHASPVEHQASPLNDPEAHSGNLKGWLQYRKLVEMFITTRSTS